MAHYVRIIDHVVVAEQGGPNWCSKEQICGPDASAFIAAPEHVRRGWTRGVGDAWHPPAAPEPPPPGPTITSKGDFFRRCTEAEAEAIETALMDLTARQRRIFEAAAYIASNDPDFDDLRAAVVALFGEARAAELFAAS